MSLGCSESDDLENTNRFNGDLLCVSILYIFLFQSKNLVKSQFLNHLNSNFITRVFPGAIKYVAFGGREGSIRVFSNLNLSTRTWRIE